MANPLIKFANETTLFEVALADKHTRDIIVVNTPSNSNSVTTYIWQQEKVLSKVKDCYTNKVEQGLASAIGALLGKVALPAWNSRTRSVESFTDLNEVATDFGVRIQRVLLNGNKEPICD